MYCQHCIEESNVLKNLNGFLLCPGCFDELKLKTNSLRLPARLRSRRKKKPSWVKKVQRQIGTTLPIRIMQPGETLPEVHTSFNYPRKFTDYYDGPFARELSLIWEKGISL